MISRTSTGLLFLSYVLVCLGGLGYLIHPSPAVVNIHNSFEAIIWGIFYLVGGSIAATASFLRPFILSRVTPLWYFEIAGALLIITSNAIYLVALYETAVGQGQLSSLSLAALFTAFTFTLVARVMDVFSSIRYIRQFSVRVTEEEERLENG